MLLLAPMVVWDKEEIWEYWQKGADSVGRQRE